MKFLTKCPYCQGHTNRDRKTLYLYALTNSYWCARCKKSGSIEELPDQTNIQVVSPSKDKVVSSFNNNPGTRFSVCRQRNSLSDRDEFEIKKSDGTITGVFTRQFNPKFNKTEGNRFFCYKDEFLVPGELYRLVEGVYDCIYPNDVALLGFPNKSQAQDLKGYNLILCPDGDVWKDKKQLAMWVKPFIYHQIAWVEGINDGLDPDECPVSQRKQLDFGKVKEYLNI